MAYVRNNWNCGDTISAQKLNNIEDGIEEALECCGGGGSSLIVNSVLSVSATGNCYTLDKTWQEIYDVIASGGLVYTAVIDEGLADIQVVTHIGYFADDNSYTVDIGSYVSYSTTTPSDYPTFCDGGGGNLG